MERELGAPQARHRTVTTVARSEAADTKSSTRVDLPRPGVTDHEDAMTHPLLQHRLECGGDGGSFRQSSDERSIVGGRFRR